jgi:hypothetical protein
VRERVLLRAGRRRMPLTRLHVRLPGGECRLLEILCDQWIKLQTAYRDRLQ